MVCSLASLDAVTSGHSGAGAFEKHARGDVPVTRQLSFSENVPVKKSLSSSRDVTLPGHQTVAEMSLTIVRVSRLITSLAVAGIGAVVLPGTGVCPFTTMHDRVGSPEIRSTSETLCVCIVNGVAPLGCCRSNFFSSVAEEKTTQAPNVLCTACHQDVVSLRCVPPGLARATVTTLGRLVSGNSWWNSVVMRRLFGLHVPPQPGYPAVASSPAAGENCSSATMTLKPWRPSPSVFSIASW